MKSLIDRPSVMADIEIILNDKSTTPKDFTLHDSAHSFRVARRMWDLIPEATKKVLSDYELGFLLLSAYLHDIGMSPNFEKVERHKDFLRGDKSLLSEKEISDFQRWIDNTTGGVDWDIREAAELSSKEVDELLTYYIRHKHNDWSGEWIEENLPGDALPDYDQWVKDLVLLCKSHHQDIDDLMREDFEPRLVGGNVVHLRYLAICLRVADVMENDPDRTPSVLLRHRKISNSSMVYWLKDRQFELSRKGNVMSLYARARHAFIQKAIEETADLIERELKLCNELISRKPLLTFRSIVLKGYDWVIQPYIIRDIQPQSGAYEYFQGAFRPNAARLLELLAGHQLYGNRIYGVRELIQNSFDAIKERIAYQIMRKNLDPDEHLHKLGELYTIDITLEKKDDGLWLICRDDGVGMTKRIIENYFLQSGASKRHEIRDLERECRKRGFELGRTGQFGIGVLSYFMLSDKVVIRTKREQNTGYSDDESVGWKFEIHGTDDFGELQRDGSINSGTQIALRLRRDADRDGRAWDFEIRMFLYQQICRSPCRVRYTSEWDEEILEWPVGWSRTKDYVLSEIGYRYSVDDASESQQKIRSVVDFLVEEGVLDGRIRYRLHIPYFKLIKGNAFVFMLEREEGEKLFIGQLPGRGGAFLFEPYFGHIKTSLKGIKLGDEDNPENPSVEKSAYVEIDIERLPEWQLGVSRSGIDWDGDKEWLREELEVRIMQLIEKNWHLFDNAYSLLNSSITGFTPGKLHWAFAASRKDKLLQWREVQYPVLCYSGQEEHRYASGILDGKNYPIWYLGLEPAGQIHLLDKKTLRDCGRRLTFDFKLALQKGKEYMPVGLLSGRPKMKTAYEFDTIDLPEEWSRILLITVADRICLNRNHRFFSSYNPKVYSTIARAALLEKDWDPGMAGDTDDWILYLIAFLSRDYKDWKAFCRKYSRIGELLDSLPFKDLFILSDSGLSIYRYNEEQFIKLANKKAIAALLPPIADASVYFSAKN